MYNGTPEEYEKNSKEILANFNSSRNKLEILRHEAAQHIARIAPQYYNRLFDDAEFKNEYVNMKSNALKNICVGGTELNNIFNITLRILNCSTDLEDEYLIKDYTAVTSYEEVEAEVQIRVKVELSSYFTENRNDKTSYKLQKLKFSLPSDALFSAADHLVEKNWPNFIYPFMQCYSSLTTYRGKLTEELGDSMFSVDKNNDESVNFSLNLKNPEVKFLLHWNIVFSSMALEFQHSIDVTSSDEVVKRVGGTSSQYLNKKCIFDENQIKGILPQLFQAVSFAFES